MNADIKPNTEKSMMVRIPNMGTALSSTFFLRCSLSIPGSAPTSTANKSCLTKSINIISLLNNHSLINMMKFEDYDFEIKRINDIIKKNKPKSLLIQLPDGLKPFATYIADKINVDVFIWAGSCFGACDIPNANFDLLIQFGHTEFKR